MTLRFYIITNELNGSPYTLIDMLLWYGYMVSHQDEKKKIIRYNNIIENQLKIFKEQRSITQCKDTCLVEVALAT